MAHLRKSMPDSGLGFQVKVLKTFESDPVSLSGGINRTEPGQTVTRQYKFALRLRNRGTHASFT